MGFGGEWKLGNGVGKECGVFLEYYIFLVEEMGNFMEKEDEGNNVDSSRHD